VALKIPRVCASGSPHSHIIPPGNASRRTCRRIAHARIRELPRGGSQAGGNPQTAQARAGGSDEGPGDNRVARRKHGRAITGGGLRDRSGANPPLRRDGVPRAVPHGAGHECGQRGWQQVGRRLARIQQPLRKKSPRAGGRAHGVCAAHRGRFLGHGGLPARGHRAHRSHPRIGR
jgi:hypothetical protein